MSSQSDLSVNRRDVLAIAGAASAGMLMAEEAAGAQNPAANVRDRASTLRITGLQATPTGSKVYVKIETNHKISGWGEITGLVPHVAAELARSMLDVFQSIRLHGWKSDSVLGSERPVLLLGLERLRR